MSRYGSVRITGGAVDAYGREGSGIGAGKSGYGMAIFLSWTNPADSIKASSYNGAVTVTGGKILVTNDDPPVAISGVGGSDFDVGLINGKTLTPSNPHAVTVIETSGGTLISPQVAGENETVTLTAYPEEGLTVSITVTDAENNEVPVTAGEGNVFSFTMPGSDVTVTATFAQKIKEDVNNDGLVTVSDVTALLDHLAGNS